MRIGSLTRNSLPQALELLQSMGYTTGLDLDWLEYRTLDDPTCLPELMLVAWEGEQMVGLLIGCLRGNRGIIKLLAVAPTVRHKGIATALLDAYEHQIIARQANSVLIAGASPNFFEPGVSLEYTDLISFLYKRGYESDRVARVDMRVDLSRTNLDVSTDLERLKKQGITVSRATHSGIEAVAAFALEHFSPEWQRETEDAARFDPMPVFLAQDGDRVVGFAVYDVNGPRRFGPTGTDPAYRQKGIGGVLLKLCLATMRDRGDETADILWAGPIGYYARAVDARISTTYWAFSKSLDAKE